MKKVDKDKEGAKDLREQLRISLLKGGPKKGKKYTFKIKVLSYELKDRYGEQGDFTVMYKTNKSDYKRASSKIRRRMNILNSEWLGLDNGPVTSKPKVLMLDNQDNYLPISKTIKRVKFELIFNAGTDTTTAAIIGSSFSAGKTTIMMNAVLPRFYGRAKPNKDGSIKEKKVDSPASINNGERPFKKIQYINTLFALNTHIKHYAGYKDLIRVTGFDEEQQHLIKEMHQINVKTDNKYRFALFIDDILNVKHSKMLENCFMTYRNAEISTCACMQHLKFLSPAMRGNIQNLIFCKLLSEEAIQSVIDVYLKAYFNKLGIPKVQHIQFYRDMTDRFHFIHLHQSTETISFCYPVKLTKEED